MVTVQIDSVTPTSGSLAGGTTVTITGNGKIFSHIRRTESLAGRKKVAFRWQILMNFIRQYLFTMQIDIDAYIRWVVVGFGW